MESQVCPLLGLSDERGAYLTYPSYENRCYAPPAPESIPLNEQTFFCLGGHTERCPRWQARLARLGEAPGQASAAAVFSQPSQVAWEGQEDSAEPPVSPWARPSVEAAELDEEILDADAPEDQDEPWIDELEPELPLPPPPPPPVYSGPTADGRPPRRPVWPLLLAAGTLVAVLMACGLLSATWVGWQALSARLALQPSTTPIVERETQVPGEGTAVAPTTTGVVVIIATLTPDPLSATATALAQTVEAMTATETPTSTPEVFFPTSTPPPFDTPPAFPTPTFTWTPRPTPTPRNTPTLFPTNTPLPTALPTNTPFPTSTFAPTYEPFSVSFTASPTTINVGQESTLTWNVRGVRAIYLDGDPVSGPTGSKRVNPTKTTTYVLRIIKTDNSVQDETQTVTVNTPSPTATPTATPTFTPTPYYAITFAQDLNQTAIDGTETSCRTGNGCSLFSIQVRNTGNRALQYTLSKVGEPPPGWGIFFCWTNDCEYGDTPPAQDLAVGSRDTVNINYRIPSVLEDDSSVAIQVSGACSSCPGTVYNQTFTVYVRLPTPTPLPTGTATYTPTPTFTPTNTPTPTYTPTPTETPPS